MHTSPLRTYPGQILGWVAGRPVYTIAGGAPDDDSGDTGSDAGGQQENGQAGDSGQTGNGDAQSGAGSSDAGNGDSKWDGKIESLPADAQKLIERYKNEAANASSKSRENARKEAETELLKKLGLVKGDEKPDPDELAKKLGSAEQEAKQSKIELAVYRGAGKHQGDADALLDSRSFLAKLADLDPTSKDFASKVDSAIKDAVAANPKLKAGRAPGASSVDHSGGTGERRSDKPTTLANAVTSHYGG